MLSCQASACLTIAASSLLSEFPFSALLLIRPRFAASAGCTSVVASFNVGAGVSLSMENGVVGIVINN